MFACKLIYSEIFPHCLNESFAKPQQMLATIEPCVDPSAALSSKASEPRGGESKVRILLGRLVSYRKKPVKLLRSYPINSGSRLEVCRFLGRSDKVCMCTSGRHSSNKSVHVVVSSSPRSLWCLHRLSHVSLATMGSQGVTSWSSPFFCIPPLQSSLTRRPLTIVS